METCNFKVSLNRSEIKNALELDQCLVTFLDLCEQLSRFAAQQNIFLVPHNEKGIHNFKSLKSEQQVVITQLLAAYLQQVHQANAEKIPLTGDNRQHVWWCLNNLGLIPSPDLLDRISVDDIIEVYNSDGIQVFRTFELFQHISYSLSELFTFTWIDLFDRNEFIFKRTSDLVAQFISGKINDVISLQLPAHIIKEKFSAEKKWIQVQQGILCPLHTEQGALGGYLHTFKILNHGSEILAKNAEKTLSIDLNQSI